MKVMHMDVQVDNSTTGISQWTSHPGRSSATGFKRLVALVVGHGLVQRWSRKVFRFLPLYAQLCTLQLPQFFSSLELLRVGRSDIDCSWAVVLQTYITASFVLEACAGLKLDLYEDGWKFHVPSATAVQHEDSSESTSYRF
jgi:hypothetical protein